jgi:ABC-type uncharacterized transport system fused permease/ATPase subunit
MKASGRTDTELLSILEYVHLEYLPKREGGWETRKEWKDVLSCVVLCSERGADEVFSGGEKQRVSCTVGPNGLTDTTDGHGSLVVRS